MEIIIIFLLILLNGFFALSEIAFVSSNENKLKDISLNNQKAKEVLELRKEPDKFLSIIQVGMTFTGIMAGTFSGVVLAGDLAKVLNNVPLINHFSYQFSLVLIIFLTTYFTIVLGELIPKTFALRSPELLIIRFNKVY